MRVPQATPIRFFLILAAVPALLAAVPLSTAAPAAPAARSDDGIPVVSKASAPPVIDGVLDDAAWAAGLKLDGFKTFKPDYGKEASQRTEAYVAYDAENFYFAFRCYDTEPSKIKASMSKRDNIFQDDLAFVILDTFNDFRKRMTLDGLVSFTYIPGTVVHLGYGSALEKVEWDDGLPGFAPSGRFHETKRGFFFKVSYLWRL